MMDVEDNIQQIEEYLKYPFPESRKFAIFNFINSKNRGLMSKSQYEISRENAWFLQHLHKKWGFQNALSFSYQHQTSTAPDHWQDFSKFKDQLKRIENQDQEIQYLTISILSHARRIQSNTKSFYAIICKGADKNAINIQILFKKLHLLPAKQIQLVIYGCMGQILKQIYEKQDEEIKGHISLVYLVGNNIQEYNPIIPLTHFNGRTNCITPLTVFRFDLDLNEQQINKMITVLESYLLEQKQRQHYSNPKWPYVYQGNLKQYRSVYIKYLKEKNLLSAETLKQGKYFIKEIGNHTYRGSFIMNVDNKQIPHGYGSHETQKMEAVGLRNGNKFKGIIKTQGMNIYADTVVQNCLDGLAYCEVYPQPQQIPQKYGLIYKFGYFKYNKQKQYQERITPKVNNQNLRFQKQKFKSSLCLSIWKRFNEKEELKIWIYKQIGKPQKYTCQLLQKDQSMQQQKYNSIKVKIKSLKQYQNKKEKNNQKNINIEVQQRIILDYTVEKKLWLKDQVKFIVQDGSPEEIGMNDDSPEEIGMNKSLKPYFNRLLNRYDKVKLFDGFCETVINNEIQLQQYYCLCINFVRFENGKMYINIVKKMKSGQTIQLLQDHDVF